MVNAVPAIEYHERTKHTPQSVRAAPGLDFENKPRPFKRYTDTPRVPLDDAITDPTVPALRAVTGLPSPEPDHGDRVDRPTVAALCHYAAGITKTIRTGGREREFRAAACTGALYHVDLYLVCGDLPDLDAGVYHFDPKTPAFDVLRFGDHRSVLADATRSPAVADAPVTFVATSTWWRNAWKYRARTYRHAFWDAGTILANLLATAHGFALPAEVVTGFADHRIVDLLGVDPSWEAPLALVPVGANDPVPDDSSLEPIDPATEPVSPDPESYPLIYAAWTASTLSDGSAAATWRCRGDRPVDGRGPGAGDRTPLDPVDCETASARPLADTITRRGSCRSYEREEISFRKFSTVLDRATRGVPMDVHGKERGAFQFVDCYCIVNGVTALDAGAYQYHPGAGELEVLHAGEYRREAGHLALDQRLGADAAVCLYFMTDLDAVTDALGDRGYRVAQFEAALTAGRLYLATYAHRDLGGTGLTFFDDAVTEFFEPRTTGQTPMFLYTLGRPDRR